MCSTNIINVRDDNERAPRYRVLLSYYTPDWFSCKRKKIFFEKSFSSPGSLVGSSCGFARAVVIIRGVAGLGRPSCGRAVPVVIIRGVADRLGPSGDRAVSVVIIRGVAGRPGSAGRLTVAVVIIRGIASRLCPARDRAVPVVIIGRFPRGRTGVGFVMIWNLCRADEPRRQNQHCNQFFHVSALLK